MQRDPSGKKGPAAGGEGAALARFFSLPAAAMPGMLNVQIGGREELLLEGCCGILLYEPGQVLLAARHCRVRVTGRALQLSCLTMDSALVQGQIDAVAFEEGEGEDKA